MKEVDRDIEGNPKEGDIDTMELMKMEQKRLKIAKYREELFRKEINIKKRKRFGAKIVSVLK